MSAKGREDAFDKDFLIHSHHVCPYMHSLSWSFMSVVINVYMFFIYLER
jgi:hypothetical protein